MAKKRKKKSAEIVPSSEVPTRLLGDPITVDLGQWYWVEDEEEKDGEFIACVTKVGSNYVEFTSPHEHEIRIHFDDFDKKCRLESNPEAVIREETEFYQTAVRKGLAKIKAVMERLGIEKQGMIAEKTPGSEPSRALAVLSDTTDVKGHKKSLIRAKNKELPKLFKEVEEASEDLTVWMGAMAIPAKAMAGNMEECVNEIENRIFNVSLYAGLTEEVEQIAKGKPANATEKLHIMQRLLYMDEECLTNYRHGGMEFKNIGEFDEWLAEPENRDRILHFPRSIVAFRVRREEKERETDSLRTMWINIDLKQLDELTFMYIRNGDQIYRMNCALKFGELIFPSRGESDFSQPMMYKTFCNSIKNIVPKNEYDEWVRAKNAEEKKHDAWEKANPRKSWIDNPHRNHEYYDLNQYEPFDKSSVHYDDAMEEVQKRIRQYNRIAVIVQGLYDRSEVLHPHPAVSLWTPEGFEAAVTLVYDGSNVLTPGKAPDFKAYRARCNQSLEEGSLTIGQDDYWQWREAEKENARRDRSWRSTEFRASRFIPEGNPGPGYLTKIDTWKKRSRKAVYRWKRERQNSTWTGRRGELLPTSVMVPEGSLFNVDAYKLGDYKQFYQDVRTRAQYLKWAPLLLAAEEYHSGNVKLRRVRKKKKKKSKKRQA